MYFVAFVDDIKTPFDPSIHAVTDLEVLSLRISQSEGQFASCEIEIINPGIVELFELKSSNMIISNDEAGYPEVMFRGTLLSIPTALSGDTVTLELIAEAPDTREKLREVVKKYPHRERQFMDPIFIEEDDAPLEDLILGEAAHFYVDRRTLGETISNDIADATHALYQPTDDILDGSLRFQQIGQIPPTKVKQRVEIEWIQRRSGKVDLARSVASKIAGQVFGSINTLTPEALSNALPGLGASLPTTSGYTFGDVEYNSYSMAREVVDTPKFEDPSGVEHSATTRVQGAVIDYYKMPVEFDYQQPRAEVIDIEIECKQAKLFGSVERVEELEPLIAKDITKDDITPQWRPKKVYKVHQRVKHNGFIYTCLIDHKSGDGFRNIEKYEDGFFQSYWRKDERSDSPLEFWHRSTFVHTERGKQAIDFAVNFAAAELRRRSRFIEISFSTPFEALKDIDTNSRVLLNHPTIPGGWSEGKVREYEIVDNGTERLCHVTISVALGGIEGQTLPPPQGAYVDYAYDAGAYQTLATDNRISKGGVEYQISGDNIIEPVNPYFLDNPGYLITKCEMTRGDYSSQLAFIKDQVRRDQVYQQGTFEVSNTYADAAGNIYHSYKLDKQSMTNGLASVFSGSDGTGGIPLPEIEFELRDLSSAGMLTANFQVKGFINFESGISL